MYNNYLRKEDNSGKLYDLYFDVMFKDNNGNLVDALDALIACIQNLSTLATNNDQRKAVKIKFLKRAYIRNDWYLQVDVRIAKLKMVETVIDDMHPSIKAIKYYRGIVGKIVQSHTSKGLLHYASDDSTDYEHGSHSQNDQIYNTAGNQISVSMFFGGQKRYINPINSNTKIVTIIS